MGYSSQIPAINSKHREVGGWINRIQHIQHVIATINTSTAHTVHSVTLYSRYVRSHMMTYYVK